MAEDFDTATASGKLQLTMVLAFSEWWRNSIRERSIAGQHKAREEGRFPGRPAVLTERQKAYVREELAKGVSQRELSRVLEVSRWKIQQVAEGAPGLAVRSEGIKAMSLLNYTTKVNAQKTVTEVMGLLVAKGANEVSIVYDDNQQPAGLKWTVQSPRQGRVSFALPCNIDAAFVKLTEQRVPFGFRVWAILEAVSFGSSARF